MRNNIASAFASMLFCFLTTSMFSPAEAARFDFTFTFDDPAVQSTVAGNGPLVGTLTYDGTPTPGVFNWSTLPNLAMSFTVGSDSYDLSDLIDPLGQVEMTIVNNGGVLEISDIDCLVGTFAQFFAGGASLAFPGAAGRFSALSGQFSGQKNGNFTAIHAAEFDFSFVFDDVTVHTAVSSNGGTFGKLSFTGPATAGVHNWATLPNLTMSFTLGSDTYDLSDLIDPLGQVEMTIVNNGGVFEITDIDCLVGNFAQFFAGGGSLAFPGAAGRFAALSSQFSGQQNGSFTTTPLIVSVESLPWSHVKSLYK